MREEENDKKVVLTGTYESSYSKFRYMKTNKDDNKKFNLDTIKLFLKKIKKEMLWKI